jgi:cytochrome c556
MGLRLWVAALGMVAVAGTALAQVGPMGDVIAQRRAGLKRMGGHMDAMKAVVDSSGDVRPLAERVDDMIAWFKGMPALFPPGSDHGDTKAQPAIWSDRGGFETANANTLRQLDALKAAATSGDTAGFATAFKATGPQFCGSCHRQYRAR